VAHNATGKPRLVVVGNGMAGMRTVEELLKLAPDLYQVTVIGAEPYGNYNRIQLSPVLAGEIEVSDIMLNDFAWYQSNNIELISGTSVTRIDRLRRQVVTSQGQAIGYDRLLLALGSSPFVPDLPGVDLEGVVSYRDIADVNAMIKASATHQRAVVIGGGLLGLEAAAGLKRRGMQVTVLHLMPFLMERQLDQPSAQTLQRSLEARGIEFILGADTSHLSGQGGRVCAVHLKDGRELPADLVVFAAGIRPRAQLAREARLQCNRGVIVNDAMQTFDPRIYAVGECAEHRGVAYGLVAPLFEQASVCANHLARLGFSSYKGSKLSTRLKVTGIEVFSTGDLASAANDEDVVLHDPDAMVYQRAVIRDGVLVGAVMVGDTSTASWLNRLVNQKADVRALRQHLLFGEPV
jgi:nitrite reductase (NADH) large subunit